MNQVKKTALHLALSLALLSLGYSANAQNNSVTQALTSGDAKVNFRLRYEGVEQDNQARDANALTLRTQLSYTTGRFNGFSGMIEMEDNRIVMGQGDYTVGPTGYNPGIYSVIADPEHTELDQGYIQYSAEGFSAKLGRQVIALDGHRFIGHVGWRQDRQTFDGLSAQYTAVKDLTVKYAYITQRNRIFAENADLDAKDHLLNLAYSTSLGTLTAYGYFLTVDNNLDNNLDTIGASFKGSSTISVGTLLYAAEYASQSSETAVTDFSASYLMLEAGLILGGITTKLGYEVLGTDDGAFGFATPLATLHKFNGWADIFLATPKQGLVDKTVTLSGKLAGGKWAATYHDFEADQATAEVEDLGSEIDLVYTTKLTKNYSAGIKFASYSGDSGRTDTDKLWVWLAAKF
jgi:hypothetical protein